MSQITSGSDPHALLAALTKLEALRDPNRGPIKRAFFRFIVRGEAEFSSGDRNRLDQKPTIGMLRDISRGGIGFVTQQPIEQNSLWRVAFLHQRHPISHMDLIVRHCQRVQDNLYLVGAQFCAGTGVLCLLGVDPASVRAGDGAEEQQRGTFVEPSEVR